MIRFINKNIPFFRCCNLRFADQPADMALFFMITWGFCRAFLLSFLFVVPFGVLLVVLGMPITAHAEESPVEVPRFWEMVTDLPTDLKIFGQESFSREGLTIAAGITAMTAITVATDYESWQAAQIQVAQSQPVRKFANAGVSIGDGFFQFGIVGAFAGAGMITENTRALRTASQITESILATGIVVQIIKHITGRESPFSSESRTGVWRVFPNQIEYMKDFQKFDAVPSGHLSTTVTTLITIQENYPEQKWIPYIGWPVVGWVAFGLAGTSIHWWSDYPIAIAVGYSIAKIVTSSNRSNKNFGAKSLHNQSVVQTFKPTLMPSFSARGEPIIFAGWTF
jgi:hypothetical protein